MDTVLGAPPHRAALRGEAAEHRENDGERIGARERAVGGPAVQAKTDMHTPSFAPASKKAAPMVTNDRGSSTPNATVKK